MRNASSVYLDLVRLGAALIVLFGHLAGQRLTGGLFWQCDAYMDEAVTAFFVISGFVISYVVHERGESRDRYIQARFTRIMSVAVPALLLTAVLDRIGMALRPDLYTATWGFSSEPMGLPYLGALLFLNRAWYLEVNVGSNLPYWSLNFEVWYYVLFGIAVFTRGMARPVLLALACLICGPVILLLLPVWLLGVAAHRLSLTVRLGARSGLGLFVGSLVCLGFYMRGFGVQADGLPVAPAFLGRAWILHEYATGALFAASIVGCSAASPLLARPMSVIARPVQWAAGATFSLYLFHLPVAQFLTTLVPWPPGHAMTRACILLGTIATAFLLAEVTERWKNAWAPVAEALLRGAKGVWHQLAPARPGGTRAASPF